MPIYNCSKSVLSYKKFSKTRRINAEKFCKSCYQKLERIWNFFPLYKTSIIKTIIISKTLNLPVCFKAFKAKVM